MLTRDLVGLGPFSEKRTSRGAMVIVWAVRYAMRRKDVTKW